MLGLTSITGVIGRSHYTTVGQTVCATVAQCEHYVRATVGQTVCPTVCRSVHTMQLLHRQKLSHVVFTLCDGLSNSFSRLNGRLVIQLCYELPINLKLRPAIRHYDVMTLFIHVREIQR